MSGVVEAADADDPDLRLGDLLARARRGDAAALGELLDGHRDYLRRLADEQIDPRLAARLDASDIVQQTCLSVHRQIEHFEGADPAQFVAWLRKVHERNILNAIRDQKGVGKRALDREQPIAQLDLPDDGDTPSVIMARGEDADRIAWAFEQLSPEERDLLRRRYFDGQSLVQIRETLGITKDALIWRMRQAMARLRELLDGPV